MKEIEHERRDWIIVAVILLFGLFCVIFVGGWALRLSPSWTLNADMGSKLDPNSDYLTNRPVDFVEAIDPSILTQPAWMGFYLTPGASIPTRVAIDTSTPTSISTRVRATNTALPTDISTISTSTLVYIPLTVTSNPASTKTSTPIPASTKTKIPTSTPTSATASTGAPTSTPTFTATATSTAASASTNTPTATSTATGTPTNTATLTATSTPTNTPTATSTPTNTPLPQADLRIAIDDGATDYDANVASVQYTVIVSNPIGPSGVTGATVAGIFSSNLTITSCTTSGDASCTINSPSGSITGTANLPVGSSITYTVNATVLSANGSLVGIVTIATPAGITDTDTSSNSATDTDTLILANSFPAGSIGNIPTSTYSDFRFSTPLVVGSGSYLVYYPQYPSPPPVSASSLEMDLVILQIGDGRNWYTVFYWGNGSSDTNTDIPYNTNSIDCTSEPDNCLIDLSLLNNPPGVTINLDMLVSGGVLPPGSYPYIRIKSPSGGDSGDGLDVNTITIVP